VIAVVDGFSAPVTAGHFIELASGKGLDNAAVDSVDESSVVFRGNSESSS
jgi:hypothetical protein